MKGKRKALFETERFLAEVGEGKTISKKHLLAGTGAAAIFYIQQGKVKLTVISRL